MTIGDEAKIRAFWREVREVVGSLPSELPEAWQFGATRDHADELLGLVLEGMKTGTSSSLWDCEDTGEPLPRAGQLNIILDGGGDPQAVVETTEVYTVPFNEVSAEHARAEGEGDRTLEHWRKVHESYWRNYSESPRGFAPDMPVVCERFRLVFPQDRSRRSSRTR